MNRIYVYPWDQLSKSAGAIAKGLGTQKLLRKGSRYQPQKGDVIVNWGASDIGQWLDERLPYVGAAVEMVVLNRDVSGALDKVVFFDRLDGYNLTPNYENTQVDAEDLLKFPVLCRTKTKGCDGDGIVIAETKADLVPAKLYVELEPKTAEYRVHIGRDPQGGTSIIGVQQKFLPKGLVGKEKRLRTTANGCYFVWTVGGELVENIVPPQVLAVTSAAFKLFPELTFVGADVIYDEATGKATVIEFNSAPEMTPQSVERYAEFFNQYRVGAEAPAIKKVADDMPFGGEQMVVPVFGAGGMQKVALNPAQGPQQVDYAGEKLPVGELRDPIEDDRKPWEKAWKEWDPQGNLDIKSAFHAGWDARKELELEANPLPAAAPYVNFMYGVRDGIDVV